MLIVTKERAMDSSKYLTSEEVMKRFFVANSTLRFWVKNNPDFPKPIKIGRKGLWIKSEIEKYEEHLKNIRK
jgi:predicted DNA-binding transcriptional regulator AlpA